MESNKQIVKYNSVDGSTEIEVNVSNETVWLTLNDLVKLFERDKSVISKHISNVFKEGEVSKESTVAKYATVHV